MMNYYSATQQQNSTTLRTADELVDERWEDNLGYYSSSNNSQNQSQESTLIKDHQLETLFQNMSTSRQVSPPLNRDKKDFNTPCFKEDLDDEDDDERIEKDYFQGSNSPVIIVNTATPLNTPPLSPVLEVDEEEDCDYLTTQAAIADNNNYNSSTLENEEEEEEDFSITAVSELPPIERIQLDQQEHEETEITQCESAATPVNLKDYHYSLVQHYKDNLLTMANENVMQSLPEMYNNYIEDIRNFEPSSQ